MRGDLGALLLRPPPHRPLSHPCGIPCGLESPVSPSACCPRRQPAVPAVGLLSGMDGMDGLDRVSASLLSPPEVASLRRPTAAVPPPPLRPRLPFFLPEGPSVPRSPLP